MSDGKCETRSHHVSTWTNLIASRSLAVHSSSVVDRRELSFVWRMVRLNWVGAPRTQYPVYGDCPLCMLLRVLDTPAPITAPMAAPFPPPTMAPRMAPTPAPPPMVSAERVSRAGPCLEYWLVRN